MVRPRKWRIIPLAVLVAGAAAAQPEEPLNRQRQERRAALAATPDEPLPEVYVAAGHLTTVAFNRPLDRDSLVVDRTRFKWVDVGDSLLSLQPLTDLGEGERFIVKVSFRDRALPAQAVLALVTDSRVVDGYVEMDRRANAPEARCEASGPMSLALSGWLTSNTVPVWLTIQVAPGDTSGLTVLESTGFPGTSSALVVVQLRNASSHATWALGQVHLTGAAGLPVPVLAARMRPQRLASGEEGLLVLETRTSPWLKKTEFVMELVEASGERRLTLTLKNK